jgi:tetratricopeptide (TPR) repeat protein
VLLAFAHGLSTSYGADPEAAGKAALAAAERAVALDPSDAEGHAALGEIFAGRGDFERAAAEFETAIRLNPGHVEVLTFYSGWASALGQPEQGAEAADRAIRLNPNYAPWAPNLYQRPQAATGLAHSRRVMEAIRSGMAMSAFQAWQQVSTIAS